MLTTAQLRLIRLVVDGARDHDALRRRLGWPVAQVRTVVSYLVGAGALTSRNGRLAVGAGWAL